MNASVRQISLAAVLWALAASGVLAQPAADPLNIRGAMAQGFVDSSGNAVLEGSRDGTFDFYEVAVNGRVAPLQGLLLSGQLMARQAPGDRDSLRLDYLQLDYQHTITPDLNAGLRGGRVKNPYGFYNSSRDVVFSRPGITLPRSIYYEGSGFRDLLFSTDGGQVYAHGVNRLGTTDFVVGGADEFDASDDFSRALGLGSDAVQVDVTQFLLGQWLQEWGATGRLRTGLSLLHADLHASDTSATPSPFGNADLEVENWVLSAQWQQARWSLTAEYLYSRTEFNTSLFSQTQRSDGGYLQYTHYFDGSWSGYLRYDVAYADREDRDGREAQARTGEPRHTQFLRGAVGGLSWQPGAHWGLYAEYHHIDGSYLLSPSANAGRMPERRTQALYLMLAYRF